MPGPPPKIDPVRRNSRTGPLKLPAEGREGPPPRWPLPPMAKGTALDADILADAEASMWAEIWATPQAVAWERLGWFRDVAQYVRWKVLAEFGDLDAAKEARMWSDRLGLNPKAMRTLLWEIVSDEVAEQRQSAAGARGRIKAVG